jgi:hypothetical protein
MFVTAVSLRPVDLQQWQLRPLDPQQICQYYDNRKMDVVIAYPELTVNIVDVNLPYFAACSCFCM